MTFTENNEKRAYHACFSFLFALIFLLCCLSLLAQSLSLFTTYHDTIQSEKNQKNTHIFKEQLESGKITDVVLSKVTQETILIQFNYLKIEEIIHKKKKGEEQKPPSQVETEESLEFIQQNNFSIVNPHHIKIKEYEFNEYHKNKATPFAIIGAIAFLLSAIFAYRRDKLIYTEYKDL